jgi:hypothetical protein
MTAAIAENTDFFKVIGLARRKFNFRQSVFSGTHFRMIKQTGDDHGSVRNEAQELAAELTISLRLAPEAAAAVDRWAARRQLSRVAAAEQLIQFGLDVAFSASQVKPIRTARAIELAASQIGQLIDPEAPSEERDRRIDRLTKGPPEFVDARVDLPKAKI